jgi:hypothetical protein
MAIAKGAKSTIAFREETTWGVKPATGYRKSSFASETLVENINRIMSEEIQPDRSVPNIRGGNISAGGDISQDLGISRHALFFKHLLGAVPSSNSVVAPTLANGPYSVGATVFSSGNIYLNVKSGSVTLPTPVAVVADEIADEIELTAHGLANGSSVVLDAATLPTGLSNTSYFVYSTGPNAFTLHTSYADSLTGANPVTFSDSGTGVTVAVVPQLSHTSGHFVLNDTSWVYLGPAATSFHKHVLTAGPDLPVGGIAVEKGILGGVDNLYLTFVGGRINTVEITVPKEGIVTATWGFLFKEVFRDTVPNPSPGSTVSDKSLSSYEVRTVIGGLLGCRAINELSINVTNNIEEDVFTHCSRYREELPEARREVTGTVTTYFKEKAEYDLFKNENVFPLTFVFSRQDQILLIELPEVKFTGSPTPQVGGSGVVTASFEFSAFKNEGPYDIRVTVLDTNPAIVAY